MKQIEVSIMGQSYILACPDGGEAVLTEAVHHVDREMCAIRDAGRVKARERIAVLAALNIAYALSERRHAAASGPMTLPPPPAVPAPPPISIDVDGLVRRIDQAIGPWLAADTSADPA
jgi:cell division protein ZapA